MNANIRTENKDEVKEYLYKNYKNSKNITREISDWNNKVGRISNQIQILQKKLEEATFTLMVLQEIKESQKTFNIIDQKVDSYINSLKEQECLNVWKETFKSETDVFLTKMLSIKNASYTGTIILNQNKKLGSYRIDMELSISSLLLGFVKEYKRKYMNINDVKIIKEGKMVLSEKDADKYIEAYCDKLKKYFEGERSPLLAEFKDIENGKYKAEDFLVYDELMIEGFNLVDVDYFNL